MKEYLKKVELFQKTFKQNVSEKPTLTNLHKSSLRHLLMMEESLEYLTACAQKDPVEIADALGDMLYVLCGTILEHGMQNKIEEVFNEIHCSNMSKLDENGDPIFREDGKILKGKNYFKPNIKKILDK